MVVPMRLRLIAAFLLVVLVTIGLFVFLIIRQNTREVSNFITRGGLTGSEQVITALEDYYRENQTWEGVEDTLQEAPQMPRLGMWSSHEVETQSDHSQAGGFQAGRNQGTVGNQAISRMDLLLVDENGNLVASTGDRLVSPRERLTKFELQRSVPLEVNNRVVGYLLREGMEVFNNATQVSLLSRLNQAAVIAVVSAGMVALILALILSYSLVRPVRALQSAATNLAAGDLSQRVQVRGKDELADLGRTFNQMAESIQMAENSRREMTADIAHELRNPLAVQRAHLEAIEDGVYPLTLENLNAIIEQNHLLTRLVEDLKILALADAGGLELERRFVDIQELIRQVVARFELQAQEREINLSLSLAESPPLLVDSQRIEQILHNLLSNALRHTPKSGKIHLKSWLDEKESAAGSISVKTFLLQIHDSGPGIPGDSLSRVFDRFYRADKSRTRLEGGTGLGLSIARKLAQAHGGELTAANHPNGGAVFTLSLPITSVGSK